LGRQAIPPRTEPKTWFDSSIQQLGSLIRPAAWICAAALGCTQTGVVQEDSLGTLSPPSLEEPYCAWFGDVAGDELIFGVSAFWGAMGGAQGDPTADLQIDGPQWIGRFDLSERLMREPVDVSTGLHPGGVWDVLALPGSRVFFSSYFDAAGIVDFETGEVERLPELGLGLNEWAHGPDGTVLVTRYGFAGDREGSVLVLNAKGERLAEHVLEAPAGMHVAAKSLAYDPLLKEIWVNTDLLPDGDGQIGHDLRVLGWDGVERRRWSEPEVQFMLFAEDGTGAFAELEGAKLWLRWRTPGQEGQAPSESRVLLDASFPVGLDFVQDVRLDASGLAVVTRWTGQIHLVDTAGQQRRVSMPRPAGELYYTAVLRGDQVCATRCGKIEVACRSLVRTP